jgi:hypothetical protein
MADDSRRADGGPRISREIFQRAVREEAAAFLRGRTREDALALEAESIALFAWYRAVILDGEEKTKG